MASANGNLVPKVRRELVGDFRRGGGRNAAADRLGRGRDRPAFPARVWRILSLSVIALAAQIGAAWAQEGPAPPGLPGLELLRNADSYLMLGAGPFAVEGTAWRGNTFAGSAEFRLGDKWLFFGPAAGVVANSHGGVYAYGGVYSDLRFGQFVVTPLFGVGAYRQGDRTDENLGGVFQFRLELTTAYQFTNGIRLGATYGHISSAGINRVNPGDNRLMVSVALPLR